MPIKTFNTAEIKMQIKPTPCLASALGNWSMAVTHESQYESTATKVHTADKGCKACHELGTIRILVVQSGIGLPVESQGCDDRDAHGDRNVDGLSLALFASGDRAIMH
eukprot:CAMPEP_0204114384 /NCGR_PEP_ID=MMETSP0361-20130328/4225_1 /ASSEMBLY_ACC=CAM_ASM_000343 /TAXON_ID=268821 /ORGANISM="Scrippsiella Hangoei, Strain SHTV-5" /LENGTH=107 /DNA_ID=CAMNT_0051064915 /DNA_START=184 /DNA_END=507 /DNA_ORIENTATION=+